MTNLYGAFAGRLVLFSSWFNLFLYITELALITQYFIQFSKGARWLHYMVIAMVLVDTLGTIATCSMTWAVLITHATSLLTQHIWTMPTLIITTATAAMLEQSFLIYRVFTLSKTRLVPAFLTLLVITHVTFKIVSAGYVIAHPLYMPPFGLTATKIAYSVEAAVDILIPMALLWQLRKVNSTFQSTRSLLRQLAIQAFSSGCVVAFVGITFLALFWLGKFEFLIISGCYGRIYTITILINLLGRKGGVPEKGVRSDGGNISRLLFDLDLLTTIESIVPNNVSIAVPSINLPAKEHRELFPQQSDETLRVVQQTKLTSTVPV